VSDAINLEKYIKTADWVITGEGKSDFQTLYGKVPVYVAKIAKKYGVKTILLSGALGRGYQQLLYKLSFDFEWTSEPGRFNKKCRSIAF
jgi:glycerate 2-kinase